MHLDVNEHTTVYAELMYMRNSSTSGIAPSGDFADNSLSINCGAVGPGLAGNPLINAQQRSVLCARPCLRRKDSLPAVFLATISCGETRGRPAVFKALKTMITIRTSASKGFLVGVQV